MKNFELVECCECGHTDDVYNMHFTDDGLHLCHYCNMQAEAAQTYCYYALKDMEV